MICEVNNGSVSVYPFYFVENTWIHKDINVLSYQLFSYFVWKKSKTKLT